MDGLLNSPPPKASGTRTKLGILSPNVPAATKKNSITKSPAVAVVTVRLDAPAGQPARSASPPAPAPGPAPRAPPAPPAASEEGDVADEAVDMVMAAELAQSMTYPTLMEIAAATTTEEALVEEAAAGRPAGVTSPSDDAILRRKRHNQRHRRYSAHGSGLDARTARGDTRPPTPMASSMQRPAFLPSPSKAFAAFSTVLPAAALSVPSFRPPPLTSKGDPLLFSGVDPLPSCGSTDNSPTAAAAAGADGGAFADPGPASPASFRPQPADDVASTAAANSSPHRGPHDHENENDNAQRSLVSPGAALARGVLNISSPLGIASELQELNRSRAVKGLCNLMVVGQMTSPNQCGAPLAPTSTPLGPDGGRAGGGPSVPGLRDISNALNTSIASRSLSGMVLHDDE